MKTCQSTRTRRLRAVPRCEDYCRKCGTWTGHGGVCADCREQAELIRVMADRKWPEPKP